MSSLTERRRVYMKNAQEVAKQTNNLRGLLAFISKKSKKSTYKNKLIDMLITTGKYHDIYERYCNYLDENDDDDINILLDYFINDKELSILELFDFVEPDNLHTKKEGFYLEQIPLPLP
jgi:hypothetical protein